MTRHASAIQAFCVCMTVWLALAAMAPVLAGEEQPPEPDGYWQGPMNGRVPATLAGGRVIDTQDLADMVEHDNPVLIDVLPAPRRPADQSTPWLPLPHRNIPRTVWIPGAGSGVISVAMANHFRERLAELTGHDREKLIVIYCRPHCWASWNAAKRAIAEGYRRVSWYPDGLEAWQNAGLPTALSTAEGPGVQ